MLGALGGKFRHWLRTEAISFFKTRPAASNKLKGLLARALAQDFHETLHHLKCVAPNIRTVIDVGANCGNFTAAAATTLSPARILAFEPNTKLHQQIRRKCTWAQIFPYALGSSTGDGVIYVHPDTGMTSLLPVNSNYTSQITWESVEDIQQVPVHIRPLTEFIDNMQLLERATLLKLDTQGTELDVLVSGGDRLHACCAIMMEHMFWSGYAGRPTFAETIRYLDDKHFELAMVCNMHFRRGAPACADFVFVPRTRTGGVEEGLR